MTTTSPPQASASSAADADLPAADAALEARLQRFLLADEGDFDALALALFDHQRRTNPDYAAVCGAVAPHHWAEIPAVPVALFRDLPLTTFPPAQATRTFRTSGTTGPRGVHRLRDTRLADRAARRWAERCVGPLPRQGISLVSHAPESSLGHMCQSFVPGLIACFDGQRGVDGARAWAALREAQAPVFVPGTAFAFADLLAAPSAPSAPLDLPEGSLVMVTGGFKGRVRALSEDDVLASLRRIFPTVRLVGEYGMTELSSQLWAAPLGGAFVAPPWMRVWAVDPDTGQPTRRGVLRFLDLANHQTVLAIETRDLGEVHPGGRVTLHGRLPGAPPRGCSLTVEEASAPPPSASPRRAPAPRLDPTPLSDPPSPDAGDRERVVRVRAALASLRALPLGGGLSEGLSEEGARIGLEASLAALTEAALLAELGSAPPARRPRRVSVVCAQGVFTAPLEWVALYAAAGCVLHIKAPAEAPDFLYVLGDALAAAGLPVQVSTARDLGQPDAVVTFGSDETLARVQAAWPQARHLGFGHRFSVIWAGGPADAEAIAADVVAYDTRGCMAPAAIFVDRHQAPGLVARLLDALRQAPPPGTTDPRLGPERRRRLGLARARAAASGVPGGVWEVPETGSAVLCLPVADLSPATLPRVAVVHPVDAPSAVAAALQPWQHQLSSLALGAGVSPGTLGALGEQVPRLCPVGHLQRPAFPRRHDGQRMLLGICLEP